MKVKSLYDGFVPLKKCGISPASAAIMSGVSAVGSSVNSVLGYNQQRHAQNVSIDAQAHENALNRDWQTVEAEKARQFDTSERLAAQNWNKYMLDYQNAYSAPSSQASRLRAAGINPVIAMGGTGTTNVSASSAASHPQSSPVPSPVGGLSPTGIQPVDLQIPQLVNSIASMISSTANAKKANVETSYLESGIPDMLRSLKTDADIRDVAKQMQGLDLELKKMSFKPAVKKAIAEAEKVTWDAMLSKLTTGKIEDERAVLKSQKSLNDALATLNTNQGKLFALDVVNYYRRLNSVLGLQSAQAAEARAVARNQVEQAELTNLERIITRNTQGDIEERTHQELVNLQKKGKILDSDVRAADAAAHQAEVAADHAEELFWKDFVLDIVSQGVDAFTKVRNSKSWSNMSDASQRRVDAKLKEIENAYGDKVEIISTPKGTTRTRTYRRPYQKYGGTTD